jgi:hypothetical protein
MRPPNLLANELHDSMKEAISDKASPYEMRKHLHEYFFRKEFNLKHKKYKVMLRWAHSATRTAKIDELSHQAT